MKISIQTFFVTGLLMAFGNSFSFADQERYATVTVGSGTIYQTNQFGNVISWGATNTVDIAEGEVGELICTEALYGGYYVSKNGLNFGAKPASFQIYSQGAATSVGTTVTGPATFVLYVNYQAGLQANPDAKGLMTVKITPLTFSPQKSVTVAPGMGNVQITMESSTNLLNWESATNGVYSDSLRFFRVKLTKI